MYNSNLINSKSSAIIKPSKQKQSSTASQAASDGARVIDLILHRGLGQQRQPKQTLT